MPRRKQHNPRKVGEEAEGGGGDGPLAASTASCSSSGSSSASEVNEEDPQHPKQPKDSSTDLKIDGFEPKSSSALRINLQQDNHEDKEENDANDDTDSKNDDDIIQDADDQENVKSILAKHDVKSSSSFLPKKDLSVSPPVIPPKVRPKFKVKKEEIRSSSPVVSDDDEDDMMDIAVPLDFSKPAVDSCRSKRRMVEEDSHPELKKVKSENSTSGAAPLDLSVKKTSHHHQPHPLHHVTHHSHRQQQDQHHSTQHPKTHLNQTHPRLTGPITSPSSSSSHSVRKEYFSPVAKYHQHQHHSSNQLTVPTSSHSSKTSTSHSRSSSSVSPPLHPLNGEKSRNFKSSLTGLITRSPGAHGRQNPWQTQWMNRSSEQTRDVFTCVWCKDRFRSLQEMTVHMKESPRCGMAGMQQAAASASTSLASLTPTPTAAPPAPHLVNGGSGGLSSATPVPKVRGSGSSSSGSQASAKEPMSSAVLAKNNVALPRKLVRGQDVWLGRGAEQTRQILKCMWCAQSFKSLDEMTRHMRITQHYTNIISQEQIISWRTPEDKLAQAQVNAVLTCKVCDEAFGSLKELSYHMVKNAHYKEHILRSITEGGHGRRRQTRERRKKSLPVRKLLELERMEIPTPNSSDGTSKVPRVESHKPHDDLEPHDQDDDDDDDDADSLDKKDDTRDDDQDDDESSRGRDQKTPSDSTRGGDVDSPSSSGRNTSESLFALEKLLEKSFDSKAMLGGTLEGSVSLDQVIDSSKRSSIKNSPLSMHGDEEDSTNFDESSIDRSTDGDSLVITDPHKRPTPSKVDHPESKKDSHQKKNSDYYLGEEEGERGKDGKDRDVKGAGGGHSTSSESLFALEKLIEKSFDSKKKNTPTGFLQKLGIDEEVCPPWQPGLMTAALPFHTWLLPKRTGCSSSTPSPKGGSKNGSISSSPPATLS